jgi:dipeptidyl aminopeptidase/acylaminoacyl peptidase
LNYHYIGAALVAITALPHAAYAAEEDTTLAAKFGAMPTVEGISLSPDGTKVAIVTPDHGGQALMVADFSVGGEPKRILHADAKDGRLATCVWSNNTRIVCTIYGISDDAGLLLGYTRNVAVSADGTKIVNLSARTSPKALGIMQDGGTILDWDLPDQPGAVLMTRQFVPENTAGTHLAKTAEGLGVEAIDTVTLRRKTVESAKHGAVEYISDGHGVVRILGIRPLEGTGYYSEKLRYSYRPAGSRNWTALSSVTSGVQTSDGFAPKAVDSARNLVYGFDDKDGYRALYSITLDPSLKREVVLARNDVDIDGLIRIGRDARVVGASYATDRRTNEYFDPELRKLSAALSKALPGQPAVDIIDADEHEGKLLIIASSDTNPGQTYLFDKSTRKLAEVLPLRPALQGATLSPMTPISYKASDGTMIPAYLTLPHGSTGRGLPAIVMPHGGPSSRDEWGFDWLVQFYAAKGFAVIQPNYRGSAGYGSFPVVAHCRGRRQRCWPLACGARYCGTGEAGDRRLVLRRLRRAAEQRARP